MNPQEFRVERDKRLKEFNDKYASLKAEYSTALRSAMNETDRAKQCMLIKTTLDKNREITQLIESFLTLSDGKTCRLDAAMIRNLRADIEKYKQHHADIKQGRDKVYSLQESYNQVQQESNVAQGTQFLYVILLAFAAIVVVILIGASRIRDVFNAQPIAPVISRGFT
jgi:hypothetical protein